MKKIFCLIFICLCGVSCDFGAINNEEEAEKVINKFYSAVNSRNYTLIDNLCQPKFLPFTKILRSLGNNLVRFRKINVIGVAVSGSKAEACVEVEDFNGFFMIMDWTLSKDYGVWKIEDLRYGFFLWGKDKFDAVQFSEKGIYMPDNDPNMIPYAEEDED
ncbi:MAG: hypothetical protein LBO06_08710 [Bacteroidales bacterium]|jgi:hypothetical protein|nr:hypothetical protein [Bacteroidales bacterium]